MNREHDMRWEEPPVTLEDVWPDDEPFPPGDAECARLVQGHPGRWRGALEKALSLARHVRDDGRLALRAPHLSWAVGWFAVVSLPSLRIARDR